MADYNHREIEERWQKYWESNNSFKTDSYSTKPKFYALDMFPYPSGAGLHVGHPEGYTATDIVARFKRMQGFEVLHPIGFDAFGLPAEQYALQTGNHPGDFTQTNIDNFKRQIKALGFSYDWEREISTTNEDYYKWTQWIFSRLYENGLAELKNMPVNYCPGCGTVLANEEVIDGKCERKGHDVIKKDMKQWILKITNYAERLLTDLDELDWPKSLKDMQRNWIGKSEGANINFLIENSCEQITVYTTRPDTVFGVTHLVLAVENDLVDQLADPRLAEEIEQFKKSVVNKSELERTELNKDKQGMFIGAYAIHPFTQEKLEIWIGDYVLNNYGSGAVMAVPAHDARDYEFAQKYAIKLKPVIDGDISKEAFIGDGKHINSDFLDGLNNEDAKSKLIDELVKQNLGSHEIKYKLRDWLFSRQRYWGEPFPIIHLDNGQTVLDQELPVVLPEIANIEPGSDGQSPLINATDWLNVEVDGVHGLRETNTMPQWAGSCWYYLRYIDPTNQSALADKKLLSEWLPVDLYIGGAEHAVLHLLYARFWHKFLYDIGVVDTKEPFQKLYNQGMILGENNEKMSKSKGNVVNPDEIVISHGADTLRLYEMFMGPLDASIAWSADGLDGSRRFLDRVWRLYDNCSIIENCPQLDKVYNQTVDKVTKHYEKLQFNTAISQLMIFVNEATKLKTMTREQAIGFLQLLNPITPHITEELYMLHFNRDESITYLIWPSVDQSKLIEDKINIIVQINGKIKAKLEVANDITRDEQEQLALKTVANLIDGKVLKKVIVVEKKLVNIVV